MPENTFNNLSNDQIKALLDIMDEKINKTQPTAQAPNTVSNTQSSDQLMQQMMQLFLAMQSQNIQPQSGPQVKSIKEEQQIATASIIDPPPIELEKPVEKAPADPANFNYMASVSERPVEISKPINEQETKQDSPRADLADIIERILEKTGFANDISQLVSSGAEDEAVSKKIVQFVQIASLVPELKDKDPVDIYNYTQSVVDELKLIAQLKKEEVTKPVEISSASVQKQSDNVPKINLKLEEKPAKVPDVKDLFKKLKLGGSKDQEVLINNKQVNVDIQMEPKKEEQNAENQQIEIAVEKVEEIKVENKTIIDKINLKRDVSQDNFNFEIQKFELLKELISTYIDGAMHRELIRNKGEIEENKTFLQELYEKAITQESVALEIDILEKILQRFNQRLGMVKAAKGTIAAWVDLDEDINNIKNMFYVEYNKRSS